MTETRHQRALIVDFGSQVTQLIARRLRESSVYCEIHPYNKVDAAFLKSYGPKAIILSGGPSSVYWDDAPMADKAPRRLAAASVPVVEMDRASEAVARVARTQVRMPPQRWSAVCFLCLK